jgi:ADP-dependent NAD(P)H-hydrate dehydratase / NAD(P)H-hydrate epimerase
MFRRSDIPLFGCSAVPLFRSPVNLQTRRVHPGLVASPSKYSAGHKNRPRLMPIPIITVNQMREWEQATWAAKRTPTEVISRVGHLITTQTRQLTRPGDPILVLAGKGHNGDDARQVVLNLTDREVTLLNVTDPKAALREFKSLLTLPPALIIEGLFGIGLKGPLEGDWARLINFINRSAIPILAVDVPAGLNADTGEPMGTAIRAAHTLTLAAPKQGLVKSHAASYVGRLELAPNIGLIACPLTSPLQWTLPQDFEDYPPPRAVDTHKGSHGHLVICAGSLGYHGAAILATRGALQAQPGLVTLVVPENIYLPVAAQSQAAMVHPWKAGISLPDSATALLFGPGMAATDLPPSLRSELCERWRNLPITVVADASALHWLPAGKTRAKALRVITPHPGEAAELLGTSIKTIQNDRPAALRALSGNSVMHGWCSKAIRPSSVAARATSSSIVPAIHGSPREAAAISWPVSWAACSPSLSWPRTHSLPCDTPSGSTAPPRIP